MNCFKRVRSVITFLSMTLCLFLVFVALTGCSKATGACNEKQTTKAVAQAALNNMKEQLSFIVDVQPGSELTKEEWRAIRAGMDVTVDNIRQTGQQGGRYECSADVVIHRAGTKESIPVTYTSEVTGSGDVRVELSGM